MNLERAFNGLQGLDLSKGNVSFTFGNETYKVTSVGGGNGMAMLFTYYRVIPSPSKVIQSDIGYHRVGRISISRGVLGFNYKVSLA